VYPFLKTAAAAGVALLLAATVQPPSAERQQPAGRSASHGAPDLPKATVDVGPVGTPKRTIRVAAGGDLQAAIDKASGGDMLVLDAGATYTGPFQLRRKDTNEWIVIASSAVGERFPSEGQRIDRSHVGAMAKLTSASGTVLEAAPGAHHYRLIGLEIAPAKDTFVRDLIVLGTDITDLKALPHHLIIDRCYIHGDPAKGGRRGIALNSLDTAVVDSHISDFKEIGADSQAIAGWNGAGPFLIANNYLEAAGENVMFGGADPTIPQLVPSDITVTRNHFAKPLAWRVSGEEAQGKSWNVKNLFELKNARRVNVVGNIFEYNWPHGQNGFAILFTPRNQEGHAPWSTVEHVTFTHNIVRHVGAGINILGHDDNFQSERTRRIAIRNNVFQDVGGSWGSGRLFQLLDGVEDVTIDHNTALNTESVVFGGDHAPHPGFIFQNNIALHNERGIVGSGTPAGSDTLRHYFPGALVRRNALVGGNPGQYPPDNFFPSSIDEVGLQPRAELRLLVKRRYPREGTDGKDIGADVSAIVKAIGGGA
jgi:hypothetical protein